MGHGWEGVEKKYASKRERQWAVSLFKNKSIAHIGIANVFQDIKLAPIQETMPFAIPFSSEWCHIFPVIDNLCWTAF